jgi:hypothetical protein
MQAWYCFIITLAIVVVTVKKKLPVDLNRSSALSGTASD